MTSANLTFFAPTFFKKKEHKNTGLNLRKSKSKIVCKYKVQKKKKMDFSFFENWPNSPFIAEKVKYRHPREKKNLLLAYNLPKIQELKSTNRYFDC